MEAGTLVAWRLRVGQLVRRGEIVAEVETDKGILEIEAWATGTVERLVVEPGTKVPVGTVIALLRDESPPASPGTVDEAAPAAPGPPAAPEPPAAAPTVSTAPIEHPHAGTPAARALARERGIELDVVHGTGRHGTVTRADVEAAAPGVGSASPRPKVSPYARTRAAALGVSLSGVEGTGPDGSVVADDVERAARAAAPREEDPQARMRRAIGAAMTRSKREIPHYYASHTVDMGPAVAWLAAENARRPMERRLLPAVLLLRAVVQALAKVPELNAHWVDQAAPPLSAVHLGVAVSLRKGGLVAPAIMNAGALDLDGLMDAFKDLVERARDGKLRASELTAPTITVTSLGDRGVETVFPIINPPQVAMVGFGKVLERPWVVGGQVVPRSVVTVSLGADHRVSDGHRGGLFLAAVASALENVKP
jgi:pyruvate dehydrogenase E2 component (dihydrolipoamide acetyltransferase)